MEKTGEGGGGMKLFSLMPRGKDRGKCRTVSNRRQIIPRLTRDSRFRFQSSYPPYPVELVRRFRQRSRAERAERGIDLYDNEVLISDTAGYGVEDVRLNIGALQERSTRKDAWKLNYKLYSKASLKASAGQMRGE